MTKSVLIIGGGMAGCAAADLMTQMGGWDITLVERAPFLGAGVRTFFHGGHPYTFGPRHFLTQNEKVYHYLNKHVPLRRCGEHQFWSYVEADQQFYNFPIHIDDINRMPEHSQIWKELAEGGIGPFQESTFAPSALPAPRDFEEFWIRSVGQTLYKKFIEQYSQKMWKLPATELDTYNWSPKGTALKQGPRTAWDTAISAYPYAKDGYNAYFDSATAGARVLLNTHVDIYDFEEKRIWLNGDVHATDRYDAIVSTISPDIPFAFCHGELPYVGRDFHKIVLPIKQALPNDVYFMYETGGEAWTRCTEFKKFTRYVADTTLLGIEVPSFNGKHYPLPVIKYQKLAERYYQEMAPGVFCLGRSGSYRYGIDIAACIGQAYELVEVLKQGGQDHPVVGEQWRL